MRILPVALALSAALHGSVVAYIGTRPAPEPVPARALTIDGIELVPPAADDPPPTEVTLLDDHTPAIVAPQPSPERHSARPPERHDARLPDRPLRGSSGIENLAASRGRGTRAGDEIVPGEPAQPGPRSQLMTMRHPKLDTNLSPEFWARFQANTKPLAPKDIAGEQLASEIETARGRLRDPKWIANASAAEVHAERETLVAKRYEHAHRELRPDGAGTRSEHQTFRMRFRPDGTVTAIEDKPNIQRQGLGASFDVSDAMMRRAGIDPYASYKLKVLDETRDERVAIGKRHRTEQLALAKQHVQKHLERLWATTSDPAARKRALFELWDDCAETGSAELVAAGAAARAHVIGFIRAKLPAGSAHAYTSAEIARFNKQRKSRAPFSPYEPNL